MKFFTLPIFLAVFAVPGAFQTPAPTPPGDGTERIVTEEIVLNVSAFDRSGRSATSLQKEDLVIIEDERLHQANSVRRIPASVMIALDTGGEVRQKKNIITTRQVASRLVEMLSDESHISLMQFHDRVEFLAEWSQDRQFLLGAIRNRTNFGRRASFISAIDFAIRAFDDTPTQNRHLILITDGLDSVEDMQKRSDVLKHAWMSGVVVHVISYTQIEFDALKPQAKIWRKGEHKPRRMPDEVMEAIISSLPMPRAEAIAFVNRVYPPRLLSLITDTPMIGSRRSHLRKLTSSHTQLSALAEYTGGIILLPESANEMIDKAVSIANFINSQFLITYEPRRMLKDVREDEIRDIRVSSRNPEISVEGARRLVIFAEKDEK